MGEKKKRTPGSKSPSVLKLIVLISQQGALT